MRSGTVVLVALLAMAGCYEDVHENHVSRAESPMLSSGADAAGAPVRGWVNVATSDLSNTGLVTGQWYEGADVYFLIFDAFFPPPAAPESDAIVRERAIHGDSGLGIPSVPRIDAVSAGWGQATLRRNNESFPDPLTGADAFAAHYYVAREANGSATIAVWVQSNLSAPTPALERAQSQRALPPVAQATVPLVVKAERDWLRVWVNLSGQAPVAGNYQVELREPEGKVAARGTNVLAANVPKPVAGEWTVNVIGQGTASAMTVVGVQEDDGMPWTRRLSFPNAFIEYEGARAE